MMQIVIWAGKYKNSQGLSPPPSSYATSIKSDVAIYLITLLPGGELTLPAAEGGISTNRVAYFVEGDRVSVNGEFLDMSSDRIFSFFIIMLYVGFWKVMFTPAILP